MDVIETMGLNLVRGKKELSISASKNDYKGQDVGLMTYLSTENENESQTFKSEAELGKLSFYTEIEKDTQEAEIKWSRMIGAIVREARGNQVLCTIIWNNVYPRIQSLLANYTKTSVIQTTELNLLRNYLVIACSSASGEL